MNATVIPVSDTNLPDKPEPQLDIRVSVESLLQRRIEAMELSDAHLISCKETHPFAQAARNGDSNAMRFVAGMFGVAQNPETLGLSTSFGWAVVCDQPLSASPRPRFKR